ncbi:MAG: hypothetical protein J6R26_00890 [Paludibacteraceae bacterium]|nr:hypothetical protein [Paludibacteraceae bacterium]
MKKILFTLALLLTFVGTISAEVLKMKATSVAYKYENEYGYWTDWTDWEECSILVVVDVDGDRITIYSSTPQEYDIYDSEYEESDGEGGTIQTFHSVDKDGSRCDLRIRITKDGDVQLYVDYSDVMLVYNVEMK